MKMAAFFLACLACPGLTQVAQARPANDTDRPNSAASAPATDSTTSSSPGNDMKQALEKAQQLLLQQAEALRLLHQEVEKQGKEIDELRHLGSSPTADAEQLRVATSALKPVTSAAPITAAALSTAPKTATGDPAPLSFRIGNATFTPGGWVDFTAFYRTTDVGSGLGTSFQSIPFKGTVQAGMTESRISAQSSRISFRVDENIRNTKVYGYAEADFNGYLPGNAYVSTNANTFRMRVYYLNIAKGKWEVLGGQGWSLLTPNRKALSPFLSDIFNTFHLDTNYQVGLTFARQAQARFVYHPTPLWSIGLSVENPEQYTGSAATFPTLFSSTETDINSSSGSGGATATPNLHPDVILKTTMDHQLGGFLWHGGIAGLLTSARTYTPASVTKGNDVTDSREGGAIMGNLNLELFKNFHMITHGYWSDGGGRYIGGLGPGFVALQKGSVTAPFTTAKLHSGSGIGGFEWQATKNHAISAYYGGAYFQRRYAADPSVKTLTYVGYGYPGSPNTQNRAIQEGSLATNSTLWRDAHSGALQFITQFSYVTRAPWYVAPGAPKNAHLFMVYSSIRYIIP